MCICNKLPLNRQYLDWIGTQRGVATTYRPSSERTHCSSRTTSRTPAYSSTEVHCSGSCRSTQMKSLTAYPLHTRWFVNICCFPLIHKLKTLIVSVFLLASGPQCCINDSCHGHRKCTPDAQEYGMF